MHVVSSEVCDVIGDVPLETCFMSSVMYSHTCVIWSEICVMTSVAHETCVISSDICNGIRCVCVYHQDHKRSVSFHQRKI